MVEVFALMLCFNAGTHRGQCQVQEVTPGQYMQLSTLEECEAAKRRDDQLYAHQREGSRYCASRMVPQGQKR